MALMTVASVRDLPQSSGAVAKYERDCRLYERRSGRTCPEEFKIPAFLDFLPKYHEADMKWWFASGMTGNNTLKEPVISYS